MNTTTRTESKNAIEYVAKLTNEVEKLATSIQSALSDALEKADQGWILAEQSEDDQSNTSGWLYTDSAWSVGLKRNGKGKKPTICHIGYQISLMGDGIPPHISEPVVHIYCWGDFVSFEEEYYVGFPLDPEEERSIEDDCLIVFSSTTEKRTWDQGQWTFSLKLMSINSDTEVKDFIIEPALRLMQGQRASSALKEAISANAIILYTPEHIEPSQPHEAP
ncbi:MAG: hypothetical protein J0L65_08030 [Xanthomonadales bacterium]|jgi:hypothetical protein|nr:hypothetical protein [Xanthomonadales bacterium]